MFGFGKSKEEKIKSDILGLKNIKVGGIKFTIKKINPLLDFPADKMPQIFTDFKSRRKTNDNDVNEKELKAIDERIKPILEAGIYKPTLAKQESGDKKWHEKGLTLEDLFIDRDIAYDLLKEIMFHALNRFKGIGGVFFLIRIKLSRFIP